MAKRKPKKKEKPPLKPGEVRTEVCYVGELRDKQKIEGKRNKLAWPKGKADKWRENPELIPDEYWETPLMSRPGASVGPLEERVSKNVFRKVAAIREEALEKGWLEEWLFTRKFWNHGHPATCENLPGLVVVMREEDEIGEVTREHIELKRGGHISKFYAPREADKLREYDRRIKAGESVDDLIGKEKCDKPPPEPPKPTPPRKKDVTKPKISVKDAFKKPEERKDKNRRARLKKSATTASNNEQQPATEEEPQEGSLF